MFVDDHATDVLAVAQVLVGLVDLVKRVLAGDQLVQLELADLYRLSSFGMSYIRLLSPASAPRICRW